MKIVVISPHKKTDTIAQLVIEGLYENNIEVIATDSGNSIQKTYSDEEILHHAESADYIFALWGKCIKNNVPEPRFYLLDKINKFEKSVYIDGSEWTCTGFPNNNQVELSLNNSKLVKGEPWLNTKMLSKCKWYFKRECYEEDEKNGIIPLNVGARLNMLDENYIEKQYDIFCSFNHVGTGLRKPVYDSCVNLKKSNDKVIITSNLPFNDYINFIKKSYIGISAWGAGNSCRRMWEIISKGTCCFAQKNEILIPNNFEDGENIVFYSTTDEFNEKIKYYLNNKSKTIEIGKKGQEHLKKYHTSKKRVEYILNILNGSNWKSAL
jgi:hypothetical protein